MYMQFLSGYIDISTRRHNVKKHIVPSFGGSEVGYFRCHLSHINLIPSLTFTIKTLNLTELS